MKRAADEGNERSRGELEGGRVAARVRDETLPANMLSSELGLAVGPRGVEAMVGREVDDDRPWVPREDGVDVRLARPVRKSEHIGRSIAPRALVWPEVLEGEERVGLGRFALHGTPGKLSRRNERHGEARMPRQDTQELAAGEASRPHDADG
jgi:hypothetical protein